MALVNCPECDASVSTRASACVSCGYPLNDAPASTVQTGVTGMQSQDMIAIPCDHCGNPRTENVRRYQPAYLALAVLALFLGGVAMGQIESETGDGIAAIVSCAVALWMVVDFFRKKPARRCQACGKVKFDVPWHDI